MEAAAAARVKTRVSAPSRGPAVEGEPPHRGGLDLAGTAALVLVALGGLNWAAVGLIGSDLIARTFGEGSLATRAIYVAVGIAALYCIVRLPRWSRAG